MSARRAVNRDAGGRGFSHCKFYLKTFLFCKVLNTSEALLYKQTTEALTSGFIRRTREQLNLKHVNIRILTLRYFEHA